MRYDIFAWEEEWKVTGPAGSKKAPAPPSETTHRKVTSAEPLKIVATGFKKRKTADW